MVDETAPAFPTDLHDRNYQGLSKREYFASQVINGICTDCDDGESLDGWDAEFIAKTAVRIADALLLELAK